MKLAAGMAAVLATAWALLSPGLGLRVRQLPPGVIEIHSEMSVPAGTELRGSTRGTVLHAAPDFRGRALVVVTGGPAAIRNLTIDGNREALAVSSGLPPYDVPFARFTTANGILAEGVAGLAIDRVEARNIAGFAVLISRSQRIVVQHVNVSDSGSRTPYGRNNATGGILLEEGTRQFQVTGCTFRNIRGNGVWTHSLYASPRNSEGVLARNRFDNIGRDAIQVGHATGIRVEANEGTRIGYPEAEVDMESRAVPVAIDTAGNVERCAYVDNAFSEINGKCIDLDGFHDGEVRGNRCVNRGGPERYPVGGYGIVMNNSNPDMRSRNIVIAENLIDGARFGGIFVIGTGHRIAGNRLLNLNTAHCNEEAARFGCYYSPGEPQLLEAGIYLGRGADRPAMARDNVIEENEITGYKMNARCIGLAPGVVPTANVIRNNRCR